MKSVRIEINLGDTADITEEEVKKMSLEESKKDTNKRVKMITNKNDTELNVFTGMFDFSDDKQAAGVFGIQHQNEDLFRKSFLGLSK